MQTSPLIDFTLHLADNALILGHRNSEWCGHGPVLEQDIAITNISLDLIGQARSLYQYAAALLGNDHTEDSLASLRDADHFKNVILVELPKGDWAVTILRQFFFSQYQHILYTHLLTGNDEQLKAIAEKTLKEVTYHVRWSSEWVIRLGDGTDESHERIMNALETLWPYTKELFQFSSYELAIYDSNANNRWKDAANYDMDRSSIIPLNVFANNNWNDAAFTQWKNKVEEIFSLAIISLPTTIPLSLA